MSALRFNRKSIGFKIFSIVIPIITVTCILVTYFTYLRTKEEVVNLSENLLTQVAKDTSQIVQKEIKDNAQLSENIADLVVLKGARTKEAIMDILKEEMKELSFKALAFVDKEGNYVDTNGKTTNISETSYFQMSIGGTRAASELYLSKIDGELEVAYCAPIKVGEEIIGIIAATKDGLEYSNIVNSLEIEYGGQAYILDRETKQVLAAPDKEIVRNLTLLPDLVKDNKEYKDFGRAAEEMINNVQGINSFKQNGDKHIIVHTGILSDYWVLGIAVNEDLLLSGVKATRGLIIIIALVLIVIATIIVYLTSRKIESGVNRLKYFINEISEGNFSENIDEELKKRNDEFGEIARDVEKININMSQMVKELQSISNKVDSSSNDLNLLFQTLNHNNEGIAHSITDVARGNSSQTENLSSITIKLDKFNSLLDNMNSCIQSISSVGVEIDKNAKNSNNDMTEVTKSMTELTSKFEMFIDMINKMGLKFEGITNITSLIQQISQKTNLLSLNAAIESARAGEAGKGFSVVAEEIRKLAVESSTSTNKINEVVEEIVSEMNILVSESEGMNIYINEQNESINNAISSFENISKSIDNIQPMINEVADKAIEVDKEKKEILSSVDELLAISEEVTASSEEIATATEEVTKLSNNAVKSSDLLVEVTYKMKSELNKFKTK